MGYLCPVCEEPFADSQQCANHLAVTAILHGESHERWLAETVEASVDESVDSWESIARTALAELVADRAEETTDHEHPGDHTHPPEQPAGKAVDQPISSPLDQPAVTDSATAVEGLDADARAILREARELTDRMQQRGPDDERKES